MPEAPTVPMLVGGRLRRAVAASAGDVADAVAAARAALPGWSGTSVHERGAVLSGIAELLDGPAADRWLWYAGWTDKLAGVLGAVHPVDGPYVSWSTPRPVGVVGVLAPGSLPGLVEVLAPALAAGGTAVVVAPPEQAPAEQTSVEQAPAEQSLPAGWLAEVLAASDLPPGVANLLTGDVAGLAAALASAGIDGLDLAGAPPERAEELTRDAAARGVRVVPAGPPAPGLARLRAWSEVPTVWHPVGR